jgi:hypothetical protein
MEGFAGLWSGTRVWMRRRPGSALYGSTSVILAAVLVVNVTNGGLPVALLRYAEARHGEAAISVWAQIAMASSSNATANHRFVGSPAASSWCPRRTFWTKAWPTTTTLALRSCLRPRTGRSRAFRRPWSHSTRLVAYRSV